MIWKLITILVFLMPVFSSAEENMETFYNLAKEKCSDISCIRKEMDRINDKILVLLTERAALALRAGDIKLENAKKAGIALSSTKADDTGRRSQQSQDIAKRSMELGLPLYISGPAFNEIMINTVRFQQEYIDKILKQISTQPSRSP